MKPSTSWSVKGIETSARAAAKQAAHERGMTLGQWMNEMILRQAGDAGEKAPARASAGRRASSAKRAPRARRKKSREQDISGKLDLLAGQLRALAREDQETAVERFSAPDETETRALTRAIARIERNEAATERTLETINARLDELSEQIAGGAETPDFPASPEDVPGYAELEAALRNVVDHLEISETRAAGALKDIQERMNAVAAQAAEAARLARAQGERDDDSEALQAMERRLAELGHRLDGIQDESAEQARAYVNKHMKTLAERVSAVHMVSQTLPEKMEAMVGEVTGRKLGQVEERIGGMVSQLRGKLEEMASGALDVERIGAQVDSLGRKLDEVSARAASASDLETMRGAIEQLSSRVEMKADRSDVESMNERLGALVAQMEAERAQGGYLPQISALEAKVGELETLMRQSAASSQVAEVMTAMEGHIGALDGRLKQTETQLAHIPQLEASIATLTQSLQASTESSLKAAEEAARRIASENTGAAAADILPEIPDHSEDIHALKEGLEAVRETAKSSDAHTRETLSAVHETLEHIIGKLNALEEM